MFHRPLIPYRSCQCCGNNFFFDIVDIAYLCRTYGNRYDTFHANMLLIGCFNSPLNVKTSFCKANCHVPATSTCLKAFRLMRLPYNLDQWMDVTSLALAILLQHLLFILFDSLQLLLCQKRLVMLCIAAAYCYLRNRVLSPVQVYQSNLKLFNGTSME